MNELVRCNRCIMDTTVPDIHFDSHGICNFCSTHDMLEGFFPVGKETDKLITQIKESGKGRPYDSIIGVSGGTDSSYTMHLAKEYGLRPLAVHFDNGWNSELAVSNIKSLCEKLKVELYTYVVNWEEFKDLQIAFLKADTPDIEVPTDIGIHATLIKTALKEKVKYVLNGHSFRAEGISPKSWTYMDGRYIRTVYKKYGTGKLTSYPNFTLTDMFYSNYIKGVKVVPFLNYHKYIKKDAKELLTTKYGWRDYGGHHHESTYTYFIQSYILPRKFNIDKRKTELSALIRTGLITREEALEKVTKESYPYNNEVIEYALSKLGISQTEFQNIMSRPPKSYHDYPTYYEYLKLLKTPIKVAFNLGLVPPVLYYKIFN